MPKKHHKERLLECGLDLMYRQGFSATGIQEIADAGGVPKGSFYNHFDSKETFAVEALGRYTEMGCEHLKTMLAKAKGSPLTRLRALFQGMTNRFFHEDNGCGCFAANLSQERANHSSVIRTALEHSFLTMQAHYTACVKEAQAVGEIDPRSDPELLAAFIINSWQGAVLRAKAQGNTKPMEQFQKVVFERLLT